MNKEQQDIKWKVGDWCFFEYELVQIKEVEKDGRVTCLSDGYFKTGSFDARDRIFPLDLQGEIISEYFESKYKTLKRLQGSQALNFPGIHKWFVQEWVRQMSKRNLDNFDNSWPNNLLDFVRKIEEKFNNISCLKVENIKIIK